MKITCIIIDDEPLARKGLSEYINDVDFLELKGEFENPLKAAELISASKPQLLFVDIQMPKMNGLEFIKSLPDPPYVIFTTAYPQFAVDGFELNAIDYLLKPYAFDRFWRAVNKVRFTIEEKMKAHSSSTSATVDHFFIKADNKIVKIFHSEVLFAEAVQNYVAIQTTTRKYLTYITFKTVEEHLPATEFLRVHKSYIVSMLKVSSIEANELRIGSFTIPISRSMKEQVMETLLTGRFLKR